MQMRTKKEILESSKRSMKCFDGSRFDARRPGFKDIAV